METSIDIIKRVRELQPAQLSGVATATGIPPGTLAKIHYGITTDPRGSTLDALRQYFSQEQVA